MIETPTLDAILSINAYHSQAKLITLRPEDRSQLAMLLDNVRLSVLHGGPDSSSGFGILIAGPSNDAAVNSCLRFEWAGRGVALANRHRDCHRIGVRA